LFSVEERFCGKLYRPHKKVVVCYYKSIDLHDPEQNVENTVDVQQHRAEQPSSANHVFPDRLLLLRESLTLREMIN
jgi:hypothetical protein